MASESMREDIRDDQKDYSWFYTLIMVAIVLGIGVRNRRI